MNNQFTPRVSDIIMYSKEEANRLENTFIGPEHLLLGLIREGEGKAIEILFNLHIDLKELKKEIENRLRPIEATKLNDEDINFNDDASKILKLCILEARQQKSETVDSEHILLAIMRQKSNQASLILNEHNVTYEKVLEMLTFQPETPKSFPFRYSKRHSTPRPTLRPRTSNWSVCSRFLSHPLPTLRSRPFQDTAPCIH